ncbi:alcohol dehydrogenase catalytic domain-containing protein [Micromonospora sp. PLK6-60]|uniref:alcohol dehydrogenase catalytic domain-containing protein n=1 Tax=Micromonospora sp. PLK6-60 TaxID=2873383 RepID=UPI001CA76C01|nr:alcohol dehydrogenase catalytic domain-containing protein [Micromonospora sp. PLK6-60]MBY8875533.1 alcohol dehydrogenase catalytic domain-containing protein [Micromonospora sp. PLK6-60]
MKAALLEQAGPIESKPLQLREVAEPAPSATQILIKVGACGVCRSNLHMVEGDWLPNTPASFPIIPGHEVVGTVSAVGSAVTHLAVGDRVGVQPIWKTCGVCQYCFSGREQLCRQRQITGETLDGGYAEYMLAESAYAYPLPDNLSFEEAAPLFCPGITAYGSVAKAHLTPGQKVAVLGVGGVGHMVIQMAALTGADVYAVTRSAVHQAVAEELGASKSFSPKGSGGSNLSDNAVDAAIVFAPSDASVAEAMRIVKPGGRIVLGVAQNVGLLDIGDERTVVGSVLGNRQQMREVLNLAAAGKLRSVHADFPLAEANEVLEMLKAGKIRARAVLVP